MSSIGRAEEHDALLQQPRVDVERPLAAVGLLDDDGDEVVLHDVSALPVALDRRRWSGRLRTGSSPASSPTGLRTDVGVLDEHVERLRRMISPANETTWPAPSRLFATSFGSPSQRLRRASPISRPRSSAETWMSSARATASSTRSALIARIACARASARNRSSSNPCASSKLLEREARPARRAPRACATRCSVSSSTSVSGSSTSTRSTSACRTRSRTAASAWPLLVLPELLAEVRLQLVERVELRRGLRELVVGSGSFFAFTSLTSTWNVTSWPARSPKRSGERVVELQDVAGALALELRRRASRRTPRCPTSYRSSGRGRLGDLLVVDGRRGCRRRRSRRVRAGRSTGSSSAKRSRSESTSWSTSSSVTSADGRSTSMPL